MKLQNKLLLPIISVVVITVLIFSVMIYQQVKESLLMNLIEAQMDSQLENLTETIQRGTQIENTFFETLDAKNVDLARSVAELIAANPEMMETSNMAKLAKAIGVDEIHVMDAKGVLTNGNIEGFFGFDFNTTEQTLPFIDLIGKKDSYLAQEPSLRGTDNVLFQYIGVSRVDQRGIVQIGLSPVYIDELRSVIGIQSLIEKFKVGKSGYAYIIDDQGITLYHKNPENVGKDINSIPVLQPLLLSDHGFFEYEYEGSKVFASFNKLDNWIMVATLPESDFIQAINQLFVIMVGLVLVFIVVVSVVTLVITSKLFRPLKELSTKMDLAGEGNFSVEMKVTSNDEIGHLGKTFNVMIRDIRTLLLTTKSISQEIDKTTVIVDETVQHVTVSNDEVSKSIEEIAKGTVAQAESSKEAFDSMNELSTRIDTTTSELDDTIDLMHKVRTSSERSEVSLDTLKENFSENVKATKIVNESINELADKSSSIGDIVDSIQSIAQQTNLLALNAAIEAARAGEQGRGFAVVAEEIRKLAEQSSKSSSEINTIISEIIDLVTHTNTTISGTTQAIEKVNESVVDTKAIFDEINEAIVQVLGLVEELGKEFVEVNRIKEHVFSDIKTISSVSEQAAAGSEEISASTIQQTYDLSNASEKFKDIRRQLKELSESIDVFKLE